MKNLILLFTLSLLASGCGSEKNALPADTTRQTADKKETPAGADSLLLEDLFAYANEAALIARFGKENVTRDTIWGGEGEFVMGTHLFHGTGKEVELSWNDPEHFEKLLSARIRMKYSEKDPVPANAWRSKTGMQLGTTLKQLETMNGGPFLFFGFDWDYGGTLSNWKKGKMEGAHVHPVLGYPAMWDGHNELDKEYNSLIGDAEFSSDLPAAQRLNPLVLEITVTKE